MVLESSQWFNIVSIVYHAISFITAGAISFLGYKAYRLLKEKKYLNFSIAFLFIMLSFIVLALTNFLVYLNLSAGAERIMGIVNTGFIAYALLTICGFFLLLILTFRIRDIKIISILSVGIVAALAVLPFVNMFHLILLVITLLLSYHFYKNCREKKTANAKIVFCAFAAMMLSHIFSLASGTNEVIYVVGNTLLVTGYMLLLIAILRLK